MSKMIVGAAAIGSVAALGTYAATTSTVPPPATPMAPLDATATNAISEGDAVRLAKQATFGPTPAVVTDIQSKGVAGWLDSQFAAKSSSYTDFYSLSVPKDHCDKLAGSVRTDCLKVYFSAVPVAMRFYSNAVNADDQLRQRVAFALSQLLVTSQNDVTSSAGLAAYQQLMLDNAFGNYRDLLKAVTLSPYMGEYLNMLNSKKGAPNENYGRELMQLFTLGVWQVERDGTLEHDAQGRPIPAFVQSEVREVSRALTGWTYTRIKGASSPDWAAVDYTQPMVPGPAATYDSGKKTFLSHTVAEGSSPQVSVDTTIEAVFQHKDTPRLVARHLIQHLVKSNPSPDYVARVAIAFVDNGKGVRGDLKAVVRAVLTDAEARGASKTAPDDGKLKEPVLLTTGLMRLVGARTDGYSFILREGPLGQQPFRSPSVFNFYPPDFPLAKAEGVLSPPSRLLSTNTIVARHNLIFDWTVGYAPTQSDYAPQSSIAGSTGTQMDWTAWDRLATDPDALIDRLDLLVLNRTLTPALKASLKRSVLAVNNQDPAVQSHKRAQTALYIVYSSPQAQIDK